MKIIEFRAENFKRLKTVVIRPDENLVQVTGRNGQGKTSVLDAIWVALAGASVAPPVPIRTGEEEAKITLDLGELKVIRKFKVKEDGSFTTSIVVETEAGTRPTSPQAVLDALAGELSFDPLLFLRMKPGDQFDTLRGFVSGYDFDASDAADKADFEARTVANRRAKDLKAQADGITLPPGTVPKKVDIDALQRKLGDAAEHNSKIAQAQASRDAAKATVEQLTARAEELRTQAAQIEEDVQRRQNILNALPPLDAPIDVAETRAALETASETNRVADRAADRENLLAEVKRYESESETLTKRIEDRQAAKIAAVSAADMPVRDVSFGDRTVLLKGVPFEQASDAEQLRASIAVAAALNPRLRIIRVRDGSLLDDLAMRDLAKFANENDMQVWIERVDSSGKVGFVLEDGEIKGDEDSEAV